MLRRRLLIFGSVQGVGFRPWIHKTANQLGLAGFVCNTHRGLSVEIQGNDDAVATFIKLLEANNSPDPLYTALEVQDCSLGAEKEFSILIVEESPSDSAIRYSIIADRATCQQCVDEFYDETNKRYLYPFITCNVCGPRYSLIQKLPFERENTTVEAFQLCKQCQEEYCDLNNRRYYAQTINCSLCGPKLMLLSGEELLLSEDTDALNQFVDHLKDGALCAIKGIGGFHLCVLADNADAIFRLRRLKQREYKPFALMVKDLAMAQSIVHVNRVEQQSLQSPNAPIVLLEKIDINSYSAVAPNLNSLGIMLPYTALHHYLLDKINAPLVLTSANHKHMPICYQDSQLFSQFGCQLDFVLTHNRAIANPCDDSVVRIIQHKERMIRRARGYSIEPLPMVSFQSNLTLVATGGHDKSTLAYLTDHHLFLTPHIGNLSNPAVVERYLETDQTVKRHLGIREDLTMVDMHSDYESTTLAKQSSKLIQSVQHHYAHASACMAEYKLVNEVCAFVFDGTGYGDDHTIWGGECLLIDKGSYQRFGHLHPFILLGAELAIKQPKRVAFSLLSELLKIKPHTTDTIDKWFKKHFTPEEIVFLSRVRQQQINSPICSSVGRLFDGISALLNICTVNQYDGHAAQLLESTAVKPQGKQSYRAMLRTSHHNRWLFDWGDMLAELLDDLVCHVSVNEIAYKFHAWLAYSILEMAMKQPFRAIVLSGGAFQNKLLSELCFEILNERGYEVFLPEKIPANDGGLAAGQVYANILHEMQQSLCV